MKKHCKTRILII